MRARCILLPLAPLACALAGCAGNPSKEAALLLVDEIDNYQAAVATKVEAEQTFYRDIRAALTASAARQAWVEQKIETRNRITRLADKAIVEDKGLQVSLLQEFLRSENNFARTRHELETARRAEIESNYRVSFESLNFKQQELSIARSKLLGLTHDQNASAQLFQKITEAAALARQLEAQAEAQVNDQGD